MQEFETCPHAARLERAASLSECLAGFFVDEKLGRSRHCQSYGYLASRSLTGRRPHDHLRRAGFALLGPRALLAL